MGKLAWAIGRMVLTIAIGLVTFWPDLGLVWQGVRLYPYQPLLVIAMGLIWVCVLALLFPMNRRWFQTVTTACLIGVMCVVLSLVYSGYPDLFFQGPTWIVVAVTFVFASFGWQRIATGLWRWAHGVAPVEDAEAHQDV